MNFDNPRKATPGDGLHHAMLSISAAKLMNTDKQRAAACDDQAKAHERVDTADIKNGKQDQQEDQSPAQPPDVLGL